MPTILEIEQLLRLATEAGLLKEAKDREQLEKLLESAILTDDEDLFKLLQQQILYESRKALTDPFHRGKRAIFLGTSDPSGLFELGTCDHLPIYLNPSELQQHMLVVGRTGAGKTNLFYLLMKQCLEMKIPFMAFDFKQDYRHLLHISDDILVLPWEKFRFNPLKPPAGVKPLRWLQVFADVFADSQFLLSGAEDFLISHLHQLYELYGVLDDEVPEELKRYPSLYELEELLIYKHYPLITKEARYLETTMNRVKAMVLALGPILDCEQGFPIERLLNTNVVIELEGLIADAQNFLVEILLAWIYHYRLAQGHRDGLRHLLLFDEGKRIFDINKERRWEQGISTIDLITARLREFGEALIVSDQEASKLTDSIKANTYTKILLSVGSGKDLQDMALSMGLNLNQREIAYLLQTGEAVIKIASKDPIPLKIPKIPVAKVVTDSELEERLKLVISQFRVSPRHKPEKFVQHLDHLARIYKVKKKMLENETLASEEGLSQSALQMLIQIAQKPFLSLTQRYRQLGLSVAKGVKLKEELLSLGLVKQVSVPLGKPGGEIMLLELTDRGKAIAEKMGIRIEEKGRGGVVHKFWQNKIKEYFEKQGKQAFVEYNDIDVFVKNGDSIAVQVSLDYRGEVEDLKKALQSADAVISASADKEIRARLIDLAQNELSPEELSRIQFSLAADFLISDGN
jgi:hypothetical protein